MNTQGATKNAVKTAARACLNSCQKLTAQLERLKAGLLDELKGRLAMPENWFRLAVEEAEALAWQTGYPHLLFPALATEKVQAVADWNARQQFIRRRNSSATLSH
ncbi:MAG TPA: hypothetical protein VF988_16655 [Verrucomicrobiae bacterium]